MSGLTLADLTGHHLGSRIRLVGDDWSVEGILFAVNHQSGYKQKTVYIYLNGAGGWTHSNTHDPATAVEVLEAGDAS